MRFFGNAEEEWRESALNDEEHHEAFFEKRYRIKTKDEMIEIVNPIWTNINYCDSNRSGIISFQLDNIKRIDIFVENIIYIETVSNRELYYDPIEKEIKCALIEK